MPPSLPWPLFALPTLTTAGLFPLDDQHFSATYQSPTHALHLHLYHATLRLPRRSLSLRPGDLTLSPAGLPSSYHLPSPGHHWCLHFTPAPPPSSLKSQASSLTSLPLYLPLGPHRHFALDRLKHITRLHHSPGPLAAAAASAALQETLLWLAMLSSSPTPKSPSQTDRALDRLLHILHTRFTQPLRVEALADEVELTQNYLARAFRQRFHTTIPRYLLTRRIDHARYLLTATNMPIARIAQRVGLPDPHHFNKQFRHLTSYSPTTYRLSHPPTL